MTVTSHEQVVAAVARARSLLARGEVTPADALPAVRDIMRVREFSLAQDLLRRGAAIARRDARA